MTPSDGTRAVIGQRKSFATSVVQGGPGHVTSIGRLVHADRSAEVPFQFRRRAASTLNPAPRHNIAHSFALSNHTPLPASSPSTLAALTASRQTSEAQLEENHLTPTPRTLASPLAGSAHILAIPVEPLLPLLDIQPIAPLGATPVLIITAMANATAYSILPPLPAYTLRPVEPLIHGIPDAYTGMALPFLAYWIVSLFFHLLDEFDLFPQYRLHTPAEVLKRNHVSRWDVFKDVIIQQAIQTVVGVVLGMADGPNMTGKEDYDIAWWAQKIRIAESWLPQVLHLIGINSTQLAKNISTTKLAMFSGALAGGAYPELTQTIFQHGQPVEAAAFAPWELFAGKAIYHVGIPALQFFLAILFVDTWQYFLHRAMHMNKWLYTTFHARHHRLYVPYAYGALYNHPFEGFLLDTLGTGLAYLVTGMTVRQSMWFFTMSTIKTVDDHCGYAFPWDPLQHLTSNNAGYHDVHHQSWGIKTNFSQPFFTFWDTILGTKWVGGDVSARYEKARIAAQAKVDADNAAITNSASSKPSPNPYVRDAASATSIARNAVQPRLLRGKAAQQAAASRQQVLDADGVRPLLREASEEQHARTAPVLVRT